MSIDYKIALASEIKDTLLDAIDCDRVLSIYTHEPEKTKIMNKHLQYATASKKILNITYLYYLRL